MLSPSSAVMVETVCFSKTNLPSAKTQNTYHILSFVLLDILIFVLIFLTKETYAYIMFFSVCVH
jgi:hypothetical protein